jgi:hypothetical protein
LRLNQYVLWLPSGGVLVGRVGLEPTTQGL